LKLFLRQLLDDIPTKQQRVQYINPYSNRRTFQKAKYLNQSKRIERTIWRATERSQVFRKDLHIQINIQKFAKLIVAECDLYFDESERLYAYSSECDNMRDSNQTKVVPKNVLI
jgi:hypothetical protein